jgi:hypothetical protein
VIESSDMTSSKKPQAKEATEEKRERVTVYLSPGVAERLRVAAAKRWQGHANLSDVADAVLDKGLPRDE